MGKHAIFVMGPAGSGKSTLTNLLQKHCQASRRVLHAVNLDPAAEEFKYNCSIDVRDLISVADVMEETELGPNGSLVFCMEYLASHMDWLEEQVKDYTDDYLIVDCPGQIELYSHLPVMRTLTRALANMGYNVCGMYVLDSVFITDPARFVSGALMCLSAMVRLELPHVNVLSKCDLLADKSLIDRFLDPDIGTLMEELEETTVPHLRGLTRALGELLQEYSMVTFIPVDGNKAEDLELLISHIDTAIQYGEDVEPTDPDHAEEVLSRATESGSVPTYNSGE